MFSDALYCINFKEKIKPPEPLSYPAAGADLDENFEKDLEDNNSELIQIDPGETMV